MLLSELELHGVAHESLFTAIGDPPIRRLDLGKDARTRDRVAGSWIAFPGRVAAVNSARTGEDAPRPPHPMGSLSGARCLM